MWTDEKQRVRVVIADDHLMVREGLRRLLKDSEFEVVGEAETGRQAVELARHARPDLVLLDVRMPDQDGLEAVAAIKEENPQVPVVMLSTYDTPEYIARAIFAGAATYLSKGVSQGKLLYTLRSVMLGEPVVDGNMMRAVMELLVRQSAPPEPNGAVVERLSQREREVLGLLAEGLSNRQVAENLGLAESTVRNHMRSIVEKLGVSDRTQAAVWAVKHQVRRHPIA